MNYFWASIKRNALWLFTLLIIDMFSALLLWLSDVQAFQTLSILILSWSLVFFIAVLTYINLKDKKKQRLFQIFISNPDIVNEEKLLQVISQQEGEQIRLLASVLRDNKLEFAPQPAKHKKTNM